MVRTTASSGDTGPIVGAWDVNQVIGFLNCHVFTSSSMKCDRHLTQYFAEGGGGGGDSL